MNKNILYMSTGAILIAFSPIITKASTLPPTTIGFYRFFFGALTLLLTILIKRPKVQIDELKSASPFLFLAGLFFSLDLWLWHRSILSVGSGVATLLANTQIFYLALVGNLVFKEKLKNFFYPSMALTFIGITITSYPYLNFSNLNDKTLGIIYGVLTGMSYACVTFSLRKANDRFHGDALIIVFSMTLFAAVISFIQTLFEGSFEMVKGMDILYMFLYGGVIHFLGWLLISKAIKHIQIAIASLLLLLQPICATIMGNLIYSEYLTSYQVMGLILSLIGIYFAMRARN